MGDIQGTSSEKEEGGGRRTDRPKGEDRPILFTYLEMIDDMINPSAGGGKRCTDDANMQTLETPKRTKHKSSLHEKAHAHLRNLPLSGSCYHDASVSCCHLPAQSHAAPA
jgi:hypothetical protein